MRIGLIACVLLALPFSAAAQSTGELWEITMQMPGMPAGMVPAQRVCQGDDPERAATQDKSKRDCKVTGRKQTATRTTVSMSCADGSTMVIDQQYNAARTEFKSTMSMKSKEGDMTMNSTGRKVGTCNVAEERRAREAQADAAKKQVAAGVAAGAAAMKEAEDNRIKQCAVSLEKMQPQMLNLYRECQTTKKDDKQCQALLKTQPEASKACSANAAEFCKRFPTAEGYMRTGAKEEAAKMCGVTTASIIAAQCPRVAKTQSPLSFLGAYCPAEAKPIAMEHCTGRDYTSKMGGKYAAFCDNYLANKDFERPPGAPARSSAPASATAPASSPSSDKTQGQQTADQVKEGVSQGINKLKGLFGR